MRFLALIGALAIIVAIGAAVYFFGGFFNVGQTANNPAIADWALASVRGPRSSRTEKRRRPPVSISTMSRRRKRARAPIRRSAASIVTAGRRTPTGPNGPRA